MSEQESVRKFNLTLLDGGMEVLVFLPECYGPHPALVACQQVPVCHVGLERDPWQVGAGDPLGKVGYAVAMSWVFHRWLAKAGIPLKRGGIGDD